MCLMGGMGYIGRDALPMTYAGAAALPRGVGGQRSDCLGWRSLSTTNKNAQKTKRNYDASASARSEPFWFVCFVRGKPSPTRNTPFLYGLLNLKSTNQIK